jgi:hypothetical protein
LTKRIKFFTLAGQAFTNSTYNSEKSKITSDRGKGNLCRLSPQLKNEQSKEEVISLASE